MSNNKNTTKREEIQVAEKRMTSENLQHTHTPGPRFLPRIHRCRKTERIVSTEKYTRN
jgi:hypothetical protein